MLPQAPKYAIISPKNVTQSPEDLLLELWVLGKVKGHNKRTLLAATGFSIRMQNHSNA